MANNDDPNKPNLNDFDDPNESGKLDDFDEAEDFDEADEAEDSNDSDDFDESDEAEEDDSDDFDDSDEAEEDDSDDFDDSDDPDDSDDSDNSNKLLLSEAFANNWDLVFQLIDSGADVNAQNVKDGFSVLFAAAYFGDAEIVKRLIDLGADVNICTHERLTPLFIASDQHHFDVFRILLEAGADPNIKSDNHAAPLHLVFLIKDQRMYDLLMKHGAKKISEINVLTLLMQQFIGECDYQWFKNCVDQDCRATAKSMYSVMVIQPTAGMSDLRFLKALVETGWSLESTTINGDTLIHIAAQAGELDNVKYLESKGLSLKSRNYHGETPIHLAVKGGFWYIFDYARQQGLDIEELDSNAMAKSFGTTLLHCAAEGGNADIVDYLIKNGSDVNKFNYDGYTPLMYAAEGHHLEVVDLLLKAGADVNARKKLGMHDSDGDSHESVMDIGNNQRVRIVASGPEGWLKATDIVGMTPLHLCIDKWEEKEKEEEHPRVFTEREFNPAIESKDEYCMDYFKKKTSYMESMTEVASKFAHGPTKENLDPKVWVQVAERLIEAGARLDTMSRQGITPLLRAINKQNFDLVRTLIQHGAKTNICDFSKRTPLQAARDTKNKRIIQLLSKQPKSKTALPDPIDRYDAALCESQFRKKEEERSALAKLASILSGYGSSDKNAQPSSINMDGEFGELFAQILSGIKKTDDKKPDENV